MVRSSGSKSASPRKGTGSLPTDLLQEAVGFKPKTSIEGGL